jgi:hypothetical protein
VFGTDSLGASALIFPFFFEALLNAFLIHFFTTEVKQKNSGSSDSLGEVIYKKAIPNRPFEKPSG